MKARDVMVAPVITATPHATIKSVAETFLKYRISAVPVVDDKGALVGIISEGDLMHRAETGTERQRPWWLQAIMSQDGLALDYVKAHARKVADAMTRQVITASPETSLQDIAALLEKHAIKRVPIVENGQLVGIVSRANLVQVFASAGKGLDIPLDEFRDSQQAAVALERAELGAHRPRQRHGQWRRGRSVGHRSHRFGTQGHSRGRRSDPRRASGERQHQDLAAQCDPDR